jgi:hypothetical protein
VVEAAEPVLHGDHDAVRVVAGEVRPLQAQPGPWYADEGHVDDTGEGSLAKPPRGGRNWARRRSPASGPPPRTSTG